jgi:putative endonuclease
MTDKTYTVYILATRKDGPLYVGITGDIVRRLGEHKSHKFSKHTAKYNIDRLVYAENYNDPSQAIEREKVLKKWRRAWKIALIERDNPAWDDLAV